MSVACVSLRRALVLALVGAGAVGGAFAGSGRATPRTVRACGLVRYAGRAYDVRETHGRVPCRKVRRVVAQFLRRSTTPRGWHCFDNNASSGLPYAASCSRGRSVLVRVYPPT